MKRTLAALAAASFMAALAGCAWMYTPQTDVAGTQFQYRPGTGVIESVTRAPEPFTSTTGTAAAAGATAAAPDQLYRLAIRMDDGRMQYIDTSESGFARGMRVRLTDGRLIEKL